MTRGWWGCSELDRRFLLVSSLHLFLVTRFIRVGSVGPSDMKGGVAPRQPGPFLCISAAPQTNHAFDKTAHCLVCKWQTTPCQKPGIGVE